MHDTPAWRDRANFIIAARVDGLGTGIEFEQIWARQLSDDEFEVCCIPFVVYDLSLGDIVRASPDDYVIDEVVSRAGHFTFRAWFGGRSHPHADHILVNRIEALGVLMEWSSEHHLAVDAPDHVVAQSVADLLADAEERGELLYETGRTK